MDVITWIGPQSDSDPVRVRRHRFHQSWYRAFVLGVPAGTGPEQHDTTFYGNMLTADDGAAGRNFLTDEIRQVAEARIAEGGTVEPFRCRHNLLSSQPMCFNLFGHLKVRPGMAAAFVTAITGRDVEVEGDGVVIEDSPGHLGDATGLDASIRYRTGDGQRGVVGIETKLTEQFSPKVYALNSKPAYRRYSQAPGAPFRSDQLERLTDSRWNQLWRNQLLCEAIKNHESRELADQVVVFPADLDTTATLVQQYATLLSRPDAIHARTLGEVLSDVEPAMPTADRPWLQAFRARYVDLDLSAALFDCWTSHRQPFDD